MRYFELFEGAQPPINWVPSIRDAHDIAAGEAAVVWVDVEKFDKAWSKDYCYLPKSGVEHIAGRYQRFGEWLQKGEPVEMPICSLGPDYKRKHSVVFGNGRHRFSWLRDHGARAIPVVTSVEDAEDMRELYGATVEKTIIREGRIEVHPYTDFMDNKLDLKVCWNPSPSQAKGLIDQSERQSLRGLVVGKDICVWDGYYVHHEDMEGILGCEPIPQRRGKFFLKNDGGYRIVYGPWFWHKDWFQSIIPISRLIAGGFATPNDHNSLGEGRLDELRGVRNDPGVQHFQDLMKDDDYNKVIRRLDRFKEFTTWLSNNNYTPLGNGCFGLVFTRPDLPYAIKIFKNDPAYLKFVELCLQRQSDPHLPKFRGKIMRLDDHFAVRMEKLIDCKPMILSGLRDYANRPRNVTSEDFITEQNTIMQKQHRFYVVDHAITLCAYEMLELGDEYDSDDWNKLVKEKESLEDDLRWANSDRAENFIELMTTQKGILETVDFLRQHWRTEMDLHNGNVMIREDGTLVIIDPFAGSGD